MPATNSRSNFVHTIGNENATGNAEKRAIHQRKNNLSSSSCFSATKIEVMKQEASQGSAGGRPGKGRENLYENDPPAPYQGLSL